MSFLNDLFPGADEALNTQIEDLKKTGLPALVATMADAGINILEKQKKESEAALQAGVKEIQARPSDPNSFGSKFFAQFKNVGLKENGLPIVIGAVALIGVGLYLSRR